MAHPCLVLGLNTQATDEQVRQAYRELVRKYPPEKEAEMFQRIARAYELMKDEEARARLRLFGMKIDDAPNGVEDIVDLEQERPARASRQIWMQAVKAS